MLVLREGVVTEVGPPAAEQQLLVDVPGRGPRAATADTALLGQCEVGDSVIVNTQAADLSLGSGGFDVVHVNLTRGLGGDGISGAHVMKLNYSSLQHAVLPVEDGSDELPTSRPVGVCFLHGQLAPFAWAVAQGRKGTRLGYVQGGGGALPGGHSKTVIELREQGLLAGTITAGASYGGEAEAITLAGGIAHGIGELGWDAAVVAPGPGIIGSGSRLGHGGMAALEAAHTALALGCQVVVAPRMSSGDARDRHQGCSHHTQTVLDLLLAPVSVAAPPGGAAEITRGCGHTIVELDVELAAYGESGLPGTTMGRSIEDDPLFFGAALAGGTLLAATIGAAS
jgi:hypothetical protein